MAAMASGGTEKAICFGRPRGPLPLRNRPAAALRQPLESAHCLKASTMLVDKTVGTAGPPQAIFPEAWADCPMPEQQGQAAAWCSPTPRPGQAHCGAPNG